jgi:hypothetical protein
LAIVLSVLLLLAIVLSVLLLLAIVLSVLLLLAIVLSVLLFLAIVLSVLLQLMDSDYLFGIFKLFLPKLELKYCSLNFNSAENVTNIPFKIILENKQIDNGQIEDDGCQVIPKADIILWASQVSKKKTFYFAKL